MNIRGLNDRGCALVGPAFLMVKKEVLRFLLKLLYLYYMYILIKLLI